jgi:hypothetical protein
MDFSRSRLSRRSLLHGSLAGGLGVAGLALVGCGDDDDDDDQEPNTATATEEGADSDESGEADSGPREFALVSGWYRGEEVKYYDFGANTKLAGAGTVGTAPLWAFITGMNDDGTPRFVEGQHNVIDTLPGDEGYSDLWEINMVTVPEDYEPDSIKSSAAVAEAGHPVTKAGFFVNCPVVPAGSTLEGGEELVVGWVNGEEVFYPDFGMNPATAVPIWVFITGMDSEGMPQFVEGQQNIIDLVPGDAGYSAFWQVNMVTVDDGYEPNSIRSAEEVRASGFEVMPVEMVVNCPVVMA